jgi:hypothetical protein
VRLITSDRNRLRQDFESKLPKNLGKPYIMSTFDTPFTCVAFFDGKQHELTDGRIIHGCELRLLEYGAGFKAKKMLAAIIGVQEEPAKVVLCALRCQGTTPREIRPYTTMIREMFGEATARSSKSSEGEVE